MLVYQTNFNGVFIGSLIAKRDPLDANNWLIPAGCVTDEPPVISENQIARRVGDKWQVEDKPKPELPPEPTKPTVEEWRQTAALTRFSFIAKLNAAGVLSNDDALTALRGGWPVGFRAALDGLPVEDAFQAELIWAGSEMLRRANPLISHLASFAGLDDAALDDLFGWGKVL